MFRALFAPSVKAHGTRKGEASQAAIVKPNWVPDEAIVEKLCASLKMSDLGNSVALPHARLDDLSAPFLFAIALPDGLSSGKEGCPDLRLLFVFFTPTSQSDTHLQLLAHLGWLAGQSNLLSSITECVNPDEIAGAISSIETVGKGGFINLGKEAVFSELGAGPGGLSNEEAARRRAITGPNLLKATKGEPAIVKLVRNFISVFAILLWVAGGLCFIPGVDMPQLGWAIFIVIIVNAVFAFWQESKAEKAVEALQRLIPRDSLVLRDGDKVRIPAADLVYGDVIFLEEGDRIPVDARVIEADGLQVNNSMLTGESRPIYKMAAPLPNSGDTWFLWTELPNMVFAGTSVAAGSGTAIVVGTAMGTEIGHIAGLTQSVKAETSPLQKEIKGLVNILTVLSIGIGILFFFLGTKLGGLSVLSAFIFTIGITVANIPEGLLPTMSLALAMGVQRMAHRQVLVKNLPSVETLGSTTVICTDKTGTLTTNHISVTRLIADGWDLKISATTAPGLKLSSGASASSGAFNFQDASKGEVSAGTLRASPGLEDLIRVAVLCNNARPGLGDPTEGALLDLADHVGMEWSAIQASYPRQSAFPFESVRKRMSTFNRSADGRAFVCVKGSPLELLACCTAILEGGQVRPLVEADRERIKRGVDSLAGEGLRTLAFAQKDIGAEEGQGALGAQNSEAVTLTQDNAESGLCFLGLTGMEDPPRPEVPAAITGCRNAGIRIIMVTGDYGLTALAIGRRIGMIGPDDRPEDCLISGQELERLDDAALRKRLAKPGPIIFARTDPAQKMRVVSCLKDLKQVVAVTGDGVNDAAALKKADIGIAMGRDVNDVAKEASSMIVLDGNFASIVAAVEEGRAVYANIRRFSTYVLASNMPELAPFIVFVLLGIPLPLTVMQILAIDLGTDLVPALGLGVEAPEPGIMSRPPRGPREHLVNPWVLLRAYLWQGGMEIALSLAAFFWAYLRHGWVPGTPMASSGFIYIHATTMTLAGIVACQVGNVFCCRTTHQSVFRVGFFRNRLVILGVAVEICLILSLVYIPFLQSIFGLAPLALSDWGLLATFPVIMLGAEELRKLIVRYREAR
ncbi:MAG TPA: HAD-IC family P-type ATPase [Rectinemataceae bacterium]|nr:HAD-IC family P-type ATPase [Rectinemataceae bacterium]